MIIWLCKEFGWTYNQIMKQPVDFVFDCAEYLSQIEKEKEKEQKKLNRK